MKLLLHFTLGALLLVLFACAAQETGPVPTRETQPRFKGVELYSWPDGQGDWKFALVDGTNRLKSEAQIQLASNALWGADAVASAFAKLAEGEQVYWVDHVDGFAFPPEPVRTRLWQAARDVGVSLSLPMAPLPGR